MVVNDRYEAHRQIQDRVRDIVATHADLGSDGALSVDEDLWAAGMDSLASVRVMVSVEEAFGVEFPDELLTRATFGRISAIADAVELMLVNAEESA